MKKRIARLSVAVLLIFAFFFLWIEYIGPMQNDKYKDELLHKLRSEIAQEFRVIDGSAECFNDTAFFLWIGVVIKSDCDLSQIEKHFEEKQLETLPIQCLPYSHEYANIHGFTGIQKEMIGADTDQYYFIFITTAPKTNIDKRNLMGCGHY